MRGIMKFAIAQTFEQVRVTTRVKCNYELRRRGGLL